MDPSTEKAVSALIHAHPGRHELITQLTMLLTTTAPPSIHVHSPFSPRRTASLIRSVLDATRTPYAAIHGAECLVQRLFFDRVLQGLGGWEIRWDEACEAFGGGRYSRDVDGFIGGLRAIARERKSKDAMEEGSVEKEKMVLVIERAERFKENLPELMVPLTRMAELSGLPFTAIFISEVSWFDLRPPYGAAIDPFIIQVSHLNRQDTISTLTSLFPAQPTPSSTGTSTITPYMPALSPLYAHYAFALYSVCSPFLVDEHELAYIAAACWPNFVSPLLADWRVQVQVQAQAQAQAQATDPVQVPASGITPGPCDKTDDDGSGDIPMDTPHDPSAPSLAFPLPSEEARMRLVRYFTPSFTRALSTLYPRIQHASQWSKETAPPPDLRLSDLLTYGGQNIHEQEQSSPTRSRDKSRDHDPAAATDHVARAELTSVAKYVLVAAFLASFNPAKTDARLLGRAPDERGKTRKRRGGGGPRKSRGGGRAKVLQRLVGPAAFPLDRLLAILGSLMEEHDEDVPKLGAMHDGEDGEDYEMEKDTAMAVGRIQVSATISELVAMRLLHRTTPPEKLDGPPAFKCGISQTQAFELARDVGIGSLADFMWDTN